MWMPQSSALELTSNPIGLTITYYAADRAVSSGE